jgi:anti-sigma B factor antagonist
MNTQVKTLAGGVRVVCITGEIDFSAIPEVRRAVEEAVATNPKRLLVDLSGVSFIASDGLGVLIEARHKADADGRKIDLIHPQPHILGLLRKTQLTRLFEIYETAEEAIKNC